MLMLATVPALLDALLSDMLTPGDDDEDLAKKLAAAQVEYLMGFTVVTRELASSVTAGMGLSGGYAYRGPSSMRMLGDVTNLGIQLGQGQLDAGFLKASINLSGSLFGLPAAQINKSIKGAQALSDGKTHNPTALIMGYQGE